MINLLALNSIDIIMYSICGIPMIYIGILLCKSLLGKANR